MVGENVADHQRHLAHLWPLDAGHRVEVDPQLVGVLQVVGPYRVRVQVDAAEVDHPRERRAVPDDDLVRGPADG